MQYIYKIENEINHKKYIGLTNNPNRRKTRHFYDLENGNHDNPHLQKAYIKYGKDNFSFEIIKEYDCSKEKIGEYEKEWISYYDSYLNGYNCNPGGDLSYNMGKLTEEEVFQILSVTDRFGAKGKELSQIYGVSIKVISNVKTRKSYNLYSDEYDKLSNEEQERIFILIDSIYHFRPEKNKNRRKYTREQIYMIYLHRDYKLPWMLKDICENFKMDTSSTAPKIKNGKIYNDYYNDYFKLKLQDKQEVLSLYIEKYNEKPFELLETPNE